MDRAQCGRPIPTVITDNTDTGFDTTGSMMAKAATVYHATQYDPSLIEAFFGMSEPDQVGQAEPPSFHLLFGVTACGELAPGVSVRS